MAEILFILLTVYVVYVVQSVVCKKDTTKVVPPPEEKPVNIAEATKNQQQKTVIEKAKPVVKKATVKKVPVVKNTVKAKTQKKTASTHLRNPETGDVDKIASSYRMTKRWIKEALVKEGLLPKIYKTAELDDAAKVKIDKALLKLAKMEKYQ